MQNYYSDAKRMFAHVKLADFFETTIKYAEKHIYTEFSRVDKITRNVRIYEFTIFGRYGRHYILYLELMNLFAPSSIAATISS